MSVLRWQKKPHKLLYIYIYIFFINLQSHKNKPNFLNSNISYLSLSLSLRDEEPKPTIIVTPTPQPILRLNLYCFNQRPCVMRSSWDAITAQGGDDLRLGPHQSSLRREDPSQMSRDRDQLDLVFFGGVGHGSSSIVDLGLGWYWTVRVLVNLGLQPRILGLV